jgi:hypothetical protein
MLPDSLTAAAILSAVLLGALVLAILAAPRA